MFHEMKVLVSFMLKHFIRFGGQTHRYLLFSVFSNWFSDYFTVSLSLKYRTIGAQEIIGTNCSLLLSYFLIWVWKYTYIIYLFFKKSIHSSNIYIFSCIDSSQSVIVVSKLNSWIVNISLSNLLWIKAISKCLH